MTSRSLGALIFDARGGLVHVTGLACTIEIQRAMCELYAAWRAGRRWDARCVSMGEFIGRIELMRLADFDVLILNEYEAGPRVDENGVEPLPAPPMLH